MSDTPDTADGSRTVAELVTPAHTSSLDEVHDLVDDLWSRDPALSDLDRTRFESALIEVVGNVVAHAANPPGKAAVTMRVTVSSDPENVRAEIDDDGGRVDVDLGTPAQMPDWMAESGRGLALAQALCDELSYRRRDGRNLWLIACRRER